MRSPFPGVDPYLQKFWPSVHHRLITYAGDMLVSKLPSSLNLLIEERILLETDDADTSPLRGYVPDVALVELSYDSSRGHELRDAGLAVAEPITIRFGSEPLKQGFIEIRDGATGGKVITTIEFLSPTNKVHGPAREAFTRKQFEPGRANVSLTEIDLVRGGDWVLSLPEGYVKREDRSDLKVSIICSWARDVAVFYPIKLNQRLPTIPIPLRKTDEPLLLDLQALLEMCYERGRYGDLIDYAKEPMPPLAGEERRWALELLQKAGKLQPA